MRIIRKLQMISTALPKLMWIKMKEERSYREYPLQLLLAQAAPLISSNPYSGYDSLQKQRLYAVMDDAMHSYQESEDENALSEKEMDEEMSEAPSMQM